MKTNHRLAAFLFALTFATSASADVMVDGQPPVRIHPAAPPQARPFSPHDVRLLPGIFLDGQQIAVNWLLSLEPDRFLANFRKEAGLQPKATHYGGWESQGVSGHAGGHYLSGCALAYASTGDPRFLERVNYMVSELAECQKANGNGYVAAIPNGKKIYAEVAAGNIRSAGFDLNGGWVPNYTLHKLFAGLRDAYRLCNNSQALAVAQGLADWMDQVHANLDESQMQKILACEHGGLNETFADLYADTGNQRYLKLSRRFHHQAILDPLARGEDVLPGKHANTQIPKLIGLATRYALAGDPADRAAADFFWNRVVYHHSYITGGHCDHEHFGPPDRLNDRLSPATTETCNVYNMLKLTRHVFGWNPQASVADFYERALLNHIRATQHPDGRVIYNLSLKPGHHKEYQSLDDAFTCCVGTGFENHVRAHEAIYFHDASNLWVNLFIASELRWKARGITLRQETRWPDADSATLTFTCDRPQRLTLRLRHPHWAQNGFQISVNGRPQRLITTPSSYAEIHRRWQTGDRLQLTFPMSLRTEAMPDNPKRIGVFYGPTLLAADLGPLDDPKATQPNFVPVLITENRPVSDWIKPLSPAPLLFKTTGAGKPRDPELVPFHKLHDRRYTVFLDLYTQNEWGQREIDLRAEQERERQIALRTVDLLRIGEMQPERDHNLQGDKTSAGEHLGRKWRHAIDGGWFSFDLKATPDQAHELTCTFWGGETGQRKFDILIDDARIATQTLNQDKPGKFFDVTYPVPKELTQGKQKVTVKFQAHPDHWAGGLYGCRLLKP
ncbi:MAG TPA: glycoside hydrolase family 127 protein [Candidatus Paceibacterota bacterium]|nr:glycoside hydrolase family 127 protein [Verrucomicrobiota bacterium]HRY48294.1 glycoside hydrolase family 127 protein [Candidatus Paceibacterota bacterium]HSA00058.1 glycoside hydrolase family 127 protein [Candidatus Paceibacterota bacterium]